MFIVIEPVTQGELARSTRRSNAALIRRVVLWYKISEDVRRYSKMAEQLIECVRRHPCLYDTKNSSYKNILIKTKLWKEIRAEINHTYENI